MENLRISCYFMLFIHSFDGAQWDNEALFQRYSQVFHTVINSLFCLDVDYLLFNGVSYNLCHLLGSLFIRMDTIVEHGTFAITKEAVQVNDL